MPGTSNFAVTRTQTKAILDTVTGLSSSRVVIGLKDFKPSDEWLRDLPTAGPYVIIRPSEMSDYNMSKQLTTYTVDVVLYYGYPDDADQDFTAVEDLASRMCAKLFDPALWTSGSRPYLEASFGWDDEYNKKPRIIEYTVTLGFNGHF